MKKSLPKSDQGVSDALRNRAALGDQFITFASMAGVIFAVELALMQVLPIFGLDERWDAVLDAVLLAVIVSPLPFLMGMQLRGKVACEQNPHRGFRLYRSFLLYSVAAIVSILVMAGVGLYGVFREYVIDEAKRDAVDIAHMLVGVEVESLVVSSSDGQPNLAVRDDQLAPLDARVRLHLASFDVVKVKIFDRSTRIIYSTDETLIGRMNLDNRNLMTALGGVPVSIIKHKDEQRDMLAEARTNIDLVETYVGVTSADGAIIGAMEIYEDVTESLQEGRRALMLAISVLFGSLVVVFGVLARIMRRAAHIIEGHTVALQASEARTRAIVDTAGDGIITMDEYGCVKSFNAAAERIFGYGSAEVIGKDVGILMPSPHRERHGEYLEKYRRGGEPTVLGSVVEVQARRKDGTTSPIELTVSELHQGDRRVFTGIVRDITDRKQAEEERIRLIGIEHERNKLQEAVAAQDQMLSVVGHELRTPLAALRATTEFLVTDEARETEEFGTFLRSINDEVVRMAGIVNDLLEAARLNSGRAKWNWGSVQVAAACEKALDEIRPLVDLDRVRLQCAVEPPDLTMSGDAEAVRRLVLNLLDNSRKHTSRGSIRVSAQAVELAEGTGVEIEVVDTGEGIDPEIADRLGTAFALNAGMAGTKYTKGTGLGISICRGIVAAHGGTVSIRSALGQGTTVTVRLRADLPEAIRDAHDAKVEQEIAA